MKKFLIVIVNVFIFSPQALSCGVCFGQVDTPMTRALNWGIIFMLGILVTVFTGVFAFVWKMKERIRQIELKTMGTKIC